MQSVPAFAPFTVLWVALGGAVGSAARFGIGELLRRVPALGGFPWATLAINVAGSLAIGWFLRWSEAGQSAPEVRAFFAIGVCGGFTTFSTFAAENLALLQAGQPVRALAHAALSAGLTVAAAALGYALAGAGLTPRG